MGAQFRRTSCDPELAGTCCGGGPRPYDVLLRLSDVTPAGVTGGQGCPVMSSKKFPARAGSGHCCDVARCVSGFFVNGVGRARQGKGCWACDRCGLCPGTGDRWVLGNPPAPRGVSVAADPYPRALSEFGSLQCGLEAPALGGDRTISDEAYRVSRLLEIGTQRRSHISWPTGKAVLGDASAAPTGIIVA